MKKSLFILLIFTLSALFFSSCELQKDEPPFESNFDTVMFSQMKDNWESQKINDYTFTYMVLMSQNPEWWLKERITIKDGEVVKKTLLDEKDDSELEYDPYYDYSEFPDSIDDIFTYVQSRYNFYSQGNKYSSLNMKVQSFDESNFYPLSFYGKAIIRHPAKNMVGQHDPEFGIKVTEFVKN